MFANSTNQMNLGYQQQSDYVETYYDDDYVEPLKMPEYEYPIFDDDYGDEYYDDEENDHETTYKTQDPIFEALFKPLDDPYFKPNPDLERLDELLSQKYRESLITPPEITKQYPVEASSYEEIKKLSEKYNITQTQAFDHLRRCPCCGSKDFVLSETYCSELCRSYCDFYDKLTL